MRQAFAHDAILSMAPEADLAAPGAAITVALCGHWQHEPPCPLAAHHTNASRVGDEVHLRTLFAAEPEDEREVRERIARSLADGQLAGPNGKATSWALHESRPGTVRPDELEHAERLARS